MALFALTAAMTIAWTAFAPTHGLGRRLRGRAEGSSASCRESWRDGERRDELARPEIRRDAHASVLASLILLFTAICRRRQPIN